MRSEKLLDTAFKNDSLIHFKAWRMMNRVEVVTNGSLSVQACRLHCPKILHALAKDGAPMPAATNKLTEKQFKDYACQDKTGVLMEVLVDTCAHFLEKPEETPLMTRALLAGNREGVDVLLEAGANIDEVNLNGKTELQRAVEDARDSDVRFLIEKGASPFVRNAVDGKNALMTLVSRRDFPEKNRVLLAHLLRKCEKGDIHLNQVDDNGLTALHHAIKGDTTMVAGLLAKGANPNVADNNGQTAMHYAAQAGNVQLFELLQKYGGLENAQDKKKRKAVNLLMATVKAKITKENGNF